MIHLLPDQVDLIAAARQKIGRGCKSLLIQGSTGSGKTVIASEIVSGALKKNKSCHFIVPRRDLIRQTSNTFSDFDIPHSFIAAGMTTYHRQKIFICSTNTLINRLDDAPDLAIFDETHVGAKTLDDIISYYKKRGTVIIGLSASPWKLSGKGLGCWYDDMVCGPSTRWLIDNGRLSDYRAFAPYSPDLSKLSISGGDYAKGELSEKMEGDRVLIGNAVKHYADHAAGKLNVTYCVSIKHSQMTAEAFRNAGIPAMHMDGETPDDERARIIKAFAKREILVITNNQLLTYGFDLASNSGIDVTVECMSDLMPTMSLALQLQKWGRVLRKKNSPAIIFDHAGNFGTEEKPKHGFPCDERDWTLEDRDKEARDEMERSISVRTCTPIGGTPGCYFSHRPAPACPNCGRVYPIQSRTIKEVEGNLSEIQIRKNKMDAKKLRGYEEHLCETLEDWLALAKQRGHKKTWAIMRHMHKKKVVEKKNGS